jgi:3-hydroxybutyryl-CoA dehydrogenase
MKIAVIGSGTMGRGIAYAAAVAGYETSLYDTEPAALGRALEAIRKDLDAGVEKAKLTKADAERALTRVKIARDLADAADGAGFVIEAVPERIDLKIELFRGLDALVGSDAVFATNTSSLSITEMGGATLDPGRVIGMHFFNPVPRMKLVEIVRGLETTEETLRRTEEVARAMGKEPVAVNESPGFVTTRINALIGNEAFYMLEAGVASARDIDRALKLGLNHPMGPFELVDLVGLDTRLAILEYLHRSLGEKFRPCPLLVKYVKAGRLGRKVGRGVYEYGP